MPSRSLTWLSLTVVAGLLAIDGLSSTGSDVAGLLFFVFLAAYVVSLPPAGIAQATIGTLDPDSPPMRSLLVALVLLAAGIVLLLWGFSASDSLSSETSELIQGAPSDKAMVLMISGGVIAALGLLSILRRPAT